MRYQGPEYRPSQHWAGPTRGDFVVPARTLHALERHFLANLSVIQRERYQARLDEVREYLAMAKLRKASITGP